jgi:hypothetical protein
VARPHARCTSRVARRAAGTAAPAAILRFWPGMLFVVILARGLHVNLSTSAPRGRYPMVAGLATRAAFVVACVSRRARRSHGRAAISDPGPGWPASNAYSNCRRGRRRCGGGGPEVLTVNVQRLPGSSTAAGDSLGRAPRWPRCRRSYRLATAAPRQPRLRATRRRSVLGRRRTRAGLVRLQLVIVDVQPRAVPLSRKSATLSGPRRETSTASGKDGRCGQELRDKGGSATSWRTVRWIVLVPVLLLRAGWQS